MLRIIGVGLLLGCLVQSISAQQSVYGPSCVGSAWKQLTDSDLAAQKLTARAVLFTKTVKETGARDTARRDINVVIADCPIFGYTILAIKQHNGFKSSLAGLPPSYGIYLTAVHLRNMEEDMLVREARRQACRIRTGAVENPQRPGDTLDSREATQCMMREAELAADIEYAKWLGRRLGLEVSRTAREQPAQQK